MLTGKNVMVTGGAGFIGSHLVERLISEKPRSMVVIDNLFLGKERNLTEAKRTFPDLCFYKQDATSSNLVKKIIREKKIDVVFNLAVVPLPASLERPEWTFSQNIRMAEVMCELLRKKEFQTLVHFSSSEVYGTSQTDTIDEMHPLIPLTPYAASKAACDHLVMSYFQAFKNDVIIIRPFNNYGPRQNERSYAGVIPLTIKRILRGEKPIIHGDGKQSRDYIYVRDTADAAVALVNNMHAHGKIINVASGYELKIIDLVCAIMKNMEYNMDIKYADTRPGDVLRHKASTRLLHDLIEFKPRVMFEEGIKKTVAWYKKNLILSQ